jgi:signal peptidase I
MKKILFTVVLLFVVVPIVILLTRQFVIDWFVVSTERFEPEITNGEWLWVCRFCQHYAVGDYLVYFDVATQHFMLERVLTVGNDGVVEVTALDAPAQELQLRAVHGKIVWQ